VLTVEGRKAEKTQREFLYQGISTRPFKRRFNLADYVQVRGAAFDNGLLQIELIREILEAMKPPDRDQRFAGLQRPAARDQGGLIAGTSQKHLGPRGRRAPRGCFGLALTSPRHRVPRRMVAMHPAPLMCGKIPCL
jgi:hypothetical protein